MIFCLSQPSLSAKDARAMLAALQQAAQEGGHEAQAIRLEGDGTGLADALRHARDAGARHIRVQPLGFPMAAGLLAWLPGAIAHWQATEGAGTQVWLGDPPAADAILPAMIAAALADPVPRAAADTKPSLGKPGWQYLPDHDTHILVCTGPRCAFRGGAPLLARLKSRLAEEGLSDRCLTTSTGCLFPCNQGPLVALYPRNQWYLIPDEDALHALVHEVIGKGGDLPHLRLAMRPARKAERKKAS